jgi:predicted DNA-binding transcriptional regulator AlpA
MAQVKKSAQVAPARKAAKLKAEIEGCDRPASRRPHRPESDAPVATPISASPRQARGPPRKFHLDKRAAAVAAAPGDDDELLTTVQCANWFGVSVQWLDIGRSEGYGPPFQKLGPHMVRYHRGTVREWLLARTHHSTSEYRR